MFDPEKLEWQKYWDRREATQETLEKYLRDMTNDLRSPLAISHAQAAGIKLLLTKVKQGEIPFDALEEQVDRLVDWNSHVIDLFNDVNKFAIEWLNQVQNSENQGKILDDKYLEWQKDRDKQEWTRETVESILLAILHEIRVPLSGLSATVEILKMNPVNPERHLALSEKRLKNLNALLYETIDYVKKRIEDEKKTND